MDSSIVIHAAITARNAKLIDSRNIDVMARWNASATSSSYKTPAALSSFTEHQMFVRARARACVRVRARGRKTKTQTDKQK